MEHTLSGFALKIVTCPNSEGEGFTLSVPKSFILGRSAADTTEPFLELLVLDNMKKRECSRRYVRFNLLDDGMGYEVSMLKNHNFAYVNNRKIGHEGDTEILRDGETIRLNPDFELKLVRAKADKVIQAS